MRIKLFVFALFIALSGGLYAQEKSGKTGGGSSSGGHRRKAMNPKSHFRRAAKVNTSGNGSSTRRDKYRDLNKKERQSFFVVKWPFKKPKKENQGFPSSKGYHNGKNKKKGIY